MHFIVVVFPAPFGPEQAINLPSPDHEANIIDCVDIPERLLEVVDL